MVMQTEGLRKWKYVVRTRALNEIEEQEACLNKFAGLGYRVIDTRVDRPNEQVVFTFQRRTRKPKGVAAKQA